MPALLFQCNVISFGAQWGWHTNGSTFLLFPTCPSWFFNSIRTVTSLYGVAIWVSFLHCPLILMLQLLLLLCQHITHVSVPTDSCCVLKSFMLQLLLLLCQHITRVLTPTVSLNHSCFSSYRLLLRHCISLFFLNGNVVEQSRSKGGKLQWGISTLKVFVSHKTERRPLRSKCLTAIYPLLLCDLLNSISVQFNDVARASTTHPVFCLPRNWFSRGALL